jgi:hypothetical protein
MQQRHRGVEHGVQRPAFARGQQQLQALVAGPARHRCGIGPCSSTPPPGMAASRQARAVCRKSCACTTCCDSARSSARWANGGKPASSRNASSEAAKAG